MAGTKGTFKTEEIRMRCVRAFPSTLMAMAWLLGLGILCCLAPLAMAADFDELRWSLAKPHYQLGELVEAKKVFDSLLKIAPDWEFSIKPRLKRIEQEIQAPGSACCQMIRPQTLQSTGSSKAALWRPAISSSSRMKNKHR